MQRTALALTVLAALAWGPTARGQERLPPPRPVESLDDAWGYAIAADRQLEATQWQVSSAEHSLSSAHAARYPTATLAGGYTLRDNDQSFVIRPPLTPVPLTNPYVQREFFSLDARIRVPLYTGGQIEHSIDAAQHEVQAARRQVETRVLDLKMRVAELFVGVLRAEQEWKVAQSHAASLESHLRDVETMYQCDRVPKNDLLAAQVAWTDSRHHLVVAENDLDAARAAYNRQLGRPLESPVELQPVQFEPSEVDLDEATGLALALRPELQMLAQQAWTLRHQAESVAAENRAQVFLEGGYTFQENRYQDPQGITAAGVGVAWNAWDFGRTRHRASALLHEAEAMTRRRADLESLIRLDVRRAWLKLDEARRRLLVTRESIDRAEENLRVTRCRYTTGVATNTDVLSAETLRIQTYRNHNNTVYDAVLAQLWLRRVTGEL